MEKLNMVTIALFAAFMLLVPKSECQVGPPVPIPTPTPMPTPTNLPPLCASQIQLANYACSQLPPFSPVPPVAPSPNLPPYTPWSFNEDADDDGDENHRSSRHGHGHGHRHSHRHDHRESSGYGIFPPPFGPIPPFGPFSPVRPTPPVSPSPPVGPTHLSAQPHLSVQLLLSTLACHLKKRIVAGGRNRWTANAFVQFYIICLPMQASSWGLCMKSPLILVLVEVAGLLILVRGQ